LSAGLNDTVKAVAEELEIKPSILKKAIKIAQKSKLTETTADHEALTDILETVGRTV
jgi:transposase-like protein